MIDQTRLLPSPDNPIYKSQCSYIFPYTTFLGDLLRLEQYYVIFYAIAFMLNIRSKKLLVHSAKYARFVEVETV